MSNRHLGVDIDNEELTTVILTQSMCTDIFLRR